MRVVAGDYKGRKLDGPLDNRVRPTSDKVKEALFSIIMNHVDDAVVCDMFAGTGGLGIEALSRGSRLCYFIDESRESIKYIEQNISKCRAEEYSRVIYGDAIKSLKRIKEKVDIFIIDPPYMSGLEDSALEQISNLNLLSENGVIVVEHHKDTQLSEQLHGFTKVKERKYGTIVLSIYM